MGQVNVAPFYFGTVFWGEEYRNYFLQFCLPSLLSPRNIPALDNRQSNRFVICTTPEDWNACHEHSTFRLLTTYVEPIFIELPSDVLRNRTTMLTMSWGHKAITALSFEAKACGIVVCPDTIISDGSVEALVELVQREKAVVLAPGIRFRAESLLPLLEARGLVKSGEPLTLNGRELAELALPNMHSETLCYQWETPYLWDPPVSCIWQMPDRSGILVHTFSWAPLLVDYSRLKRHDVDVFENWTMDGDYIHANFGDNDLIHVVEDSDEALMVSFTRESVWSLPMREHWSARFPRIESYRKSLVLRRFMFSDAIDPLKRRIFHVPVRFHTHDVTTAWMEKEREVRALLGRIVHPPSPTDLIVTYVMRLVQQVQNTYSCCRWLFQNRRFVWQRICRRIGFVTNTSNIQ